MNIVDTKKPVAVATIKNEFYDKANRQSINKQ